MTLAAGQQDELALTIGLDENHNYSTVTNGGEHVDPTYVRPGH